MHQTTHLTRQRASNPLRKGCPESGRGPQLPQEDHTTLQVSQHDLSNTDSSASESNWALLVSSRPARSMGWAENEGHSSSPSVADEERLSSTGVLHRTHGSSEKPLAPRAQWEVVNLPRDIHRSHHKGMALGHN